MDIILNKENRLGTYTPNAKKGLLKSVNKRPLSDVLNIFDPKERKSPGFDGCSKSPLKEKCDGVFEDLKYILKQSELDVPVEAVENEIRPIGPAFDDCVKSLPEEFNESYYFLKYQEFNVPDDYQDIIPIKAWPTKDELNNFIFGYCKSHIDSKNDVQDLDYIQFESPVDEDFNIFDDDSSSISEVSFCSSIDFDMFSDDDIDD